MNHAPKGVPVPPLECTFDDIPENGATAAPAPRTRYEKLEMKIREQTHFPFISICAELHMQVELEDMLREKDAQLERLAGSGLHHNPRDPFPSTIPSVGMPLHTMAHISPPVTPPTAASGLTNGVHLNASNTVLWPSWPTNLPSFELLHHL